MLHIYLSMLSTDEEKYKMAGLYRYHGPSVRPYVFRISPLSSTRWNGLDIPAVHSRAA